MSEEEIIKNIEKDIFRFNDLLYFYETDNLYDWINIDEVREKIKTYQGILDLYNKEKEKNKELEKQKDFAFNFNETLQEELKRFKRENKNTIIITISVDNSIYKVDTQIENKWNLIENKNYYLADNYKEPSKVKFIEWCGSCSVNDIYLIACSCNNNGNIEYYHPSSLYKTKEKASEAYLKSKNY